MAKIKAKAGDKVKIITDEKVYEGILMPRAKILDPEFTILKLSHGYNIGISNSRIKSVDVLKEYKQKPETYTKIKQKKGLPNISILSFGGTISSKVDYVTGGTYADYTAEDFAAMLPEIKEIANIKARKVMGIMSEDFGFSVWKKIAEEIIKEFKSGADGVVVSQGTDTLHFSTSAVSFFLKGLTKPVVFTASQRSIDRGSSDAFMNLVCAVNAAASSGIAEVVTCMHGTINDDYCLLIRGTKVRKMHTSRRDAFRPINDLPIAKVFYDGKIDIINEDFNKVSEGTPELDAKYEKRTALINVYPGMDPEIIDFYIDKGYRGIVLAATALGHVPTEDSEGNLIPKIKKAISKGITIVIASQTLYGRVHAYVYSNLRKLSIGLNCIFVEDMMPETAYVKLAWALAHSKNSEETKELMQKNIAGEVTKRSIEKTFLL